MSHFGHDRYLIGDWILIRSRNLLTREDLEHVLEPRAAELLAFLAERHREVVSMDDLLQDLWQGRLVTDSSVYRLIAELRRTLGDDARTPRYIETVRKRGYRLIGEVSCIQGSPSSPTPDPPTPIPPPPEAGSEATGAALQAPPPPRPSTPTAQALRRPAWQGALAFATLVLVAALVLVGQRSGLLERDEPAPPPVLVVLPVEALTPGTQPWLTDGLARTLTDRLSAIPELDVIAWPSVREATRESSTPSLVATRLGSDLLLSTGVLVDSATPDRLRLNAALVHAQSGKQLWAGTFLGDLTDLLGLYERLSAEIARELDLRLFADARATRQSRSIGNVEAMEAYLKGQAALAAGYQADQLEQAIAYFDLVTERSPTFLPAIADRAIAHTRLYTNYHDRTEGRLTLAQADVELALRLDPSSPATQYANGYLLIARGNSLEAARELQRAQAAQPSNAATLAALSDVAARTGDSDAAQAYVAEAVRLDPLNALYLYDLALKQMNAGDFARAQANFGRATAVNPEMVEPYLYRAWTQIAWLGDVRAANGELNRLLEQVGEDDLMQLLLGSGLWGVFTWSDEWLSALLRDWSIEESGGDLATWHLAMAELALREGDAEARRNHYAAATDARINDIKDQPNAPWLHAELAIAYAGQGLRAPALRAADQAISLSPAADNPWDGVDFLWARATVLAMLDDLPATVDQVRAASRYPSLTTPNALRVDANWNALFELPAFTAMMSEDGSHWLTKASAD